jgi:putative lipase involved disintegration of autophagic bodies
MYPQASVWLTGHSLGGALASLVAQTNRLPAFTFEAPGDLLFADRVGLLPQFSDPLARFDYLRSLPIYHFGNAGDPVFLGLCRGPTSSCYFSGYAMESKCHAGKVCLYDRKSPSEQDPDHETPADPDKDVKSAPFLFRKWKSLANSRNFEDRNDNRPIEAKMVDIRHHRLTYLISEYLEKRTSVPECFVEFGCEDCSEWAYSE